MSIGDLQNTSSHDILFLRDMCGKAIRNANRLYMKTDKAFPLFLSQNTHTHTCPHRKTQTHIYTHAHTHTCPHRKTQTHIHTHMST